MLVVATGLEYRLECPPARTDGHGTVVTIYCSWLITRTMIISNPRTHYVISYALRGLMQDSISHYYPCFCRVSSYHDICIIHV
eukprot:6198411-Pleurochrysis_carterae.AAC.1